MLVLPPLLSLFIFIPVSGPGDSYGCCLCWLSSCAWWWSMISSTAAQQISDTFSRVRFSSLHRVAGERIRYLRPQSVKRPISECQSINELTTDSINQIVESLCVADYSKGCIESLFWCLLTSCICSANLMGINCVLGSEALVVVVSSFCWWLR